MTFKFPAATKLVVLLRRGCRCSQSALAPPRPTPRPSASQVNGAATTMHGPAYGPAGPNRSYQSGPRTRVYVTTRSWLDAGTEVLPGDRKFTRLRLPAARTSFARENLNRPLDRQPLNPSSDLGGYPQASRCIDRDIAS